MKNLKQKGINLIEVVIIIAVIGIILAIAIPQFSKIKKAQVLRNAVQDIFSTLQKAHSQTLSSLDSSAYGVHFQTDKIVLFKGTLYSSNSPYNQNISIISPATISTISLTGGVSDIYFARLSGMPNVSGTITASITGDAGSTKTVSISSTGAININ